MYGETQSGMQCLEFDALLADALDGALTGADRERFEAHRASCLSCGPMFAEASAGRAWLAELKDVEPPANLVHNILAATIGQVEAPAPAAHHGEGVWHRLRGWVQPVVAPLLQPRFAMSFGMAFFSVSLILNLLGVRLSDLRYVDLTPSGIVRGYYDTQARITRYYENIRVVYEIESRVQQLKRATTPEESNPPATAPKERKDNSGEPSKQYQNYSRDDNSVTLAQLFDLGTGFATRRES
jgi:hypothetical protein